MSSIDKICEELNSFKTCRAFDDIKPRIQHGSLFSIDYDNQYPDRWCWHVRFTSALLFPHIKLTIGGITIPLNRKERKELLKAAKTAWSNEIVKYNNHIIVLKNGS